MEKNKLENLNIDELKNKLKLVKTVTGILAGALLILFCLGMYLTITKKFAAISIIPIALLPILILNINNINNLKKEIQTRENKK